GLLFGVEALTASGTIDPGGGGDAADRIELTITARKRPDLISVRRLVRNLMERHVEQETTLRNGDIYYQLFPELSVADLQPTGQPLSRQAFLEEARAFLDDYRSEEEERQIALVFSQLVSHAVAGGATLSYQAFENMELASFDAEAEAIYKATDAFFAALSAYDYPEGLDPSQVLVRQVIRELLPGYTLSMSVPSIALRSAWAQDMAATIHWSDSAQ
ncbi:MAG: hypothetical protein MI919_25015, partial [Holophagales bacterium]|nr:hypothetical protein [Holophagales bacterium]